MKHLLMLVVFLATCAYAQTDTKKPRAYVIHRDRAACEMLSAYHVPCTQQVQVFINTPDLRAEAFKVVLSFVKNGALDSATEILPANVVKNSPFVSCAIIFELEDVKVKSVLVVPLVSSEHSVLVEQSSN